MLKDYKRKRIALLLALISLSILVIIFMIPGTSFYYGGKVVALVDNERIYENDIKDELLEMFPGSNPKTFEVRRLPQNVLELIAKGVFIKRHIYRDARNNMVHQDAEVRDKINRYSKKTIREHFIDEKIGKKVNKKAIQAKYLELSDKVKEDKEFSIGHILLKTKYQADKVIEKINDKQSFFVLAGKYSLDKKTNKKGGRLGYFKEDKVKKEFSVILNMKEGNISDPIKTDSGWHVLKLIDIKTPKLEDFDKIKDKIVEELRREEIDKIFSQISQDSTVKILIEHP